MRRAEEDELTFWNEEIVKEGSLIARRRYEVMASLAAICRERHNELTGAQEELTIDYRPNVPLQGRLDSSVEETQQEFMAALEASRLRELRMGSTVVGPHRRRL